MSTFDLASLIRPELSQVVPYVPDLRHYDIRLDANEAPSLLQADVLAQLARAAGEIAWERYPDPTAAELRRVIAGRVGVSTGEIVMGAGSDELISLLLTVLSRPRRSGVATVLTLSPTFIMYRLNALARGQNLVEIPLDDDWQLPIDALVHAVRESAPNVIFIASPNNPTGTLADPERIEHLIANAPDSLVVIDEAYVDYASRNQLHLYHRYPNVAILRTLSKVGFAALRVGYIVARPDLATAIDKTRSPYNVATVSQRLATLVLTRFAAEVDATVRAVVAERERMSRALAELGVPLSASEANFLWMRTAQPAENVQAELGKRGILVRSFHRQGGRLTHQLRVSVSTPHDNDCFLTAMRELLV